MIRRAAAGWFFLCSLPSWLGEKRDATREFFVFLQANSSRRPESANMNRKSSYFDDLGRPTPLQIFKSLLNKIKFILSAILCAIWNFKEKHSANSFIRFGFCAFLCMSASNLFLSFHLIVNYFSLDVKTRRRKLRFNHVFVHDQSFRDTAVVWDIKLRGVWNNSILTSTSWIQCFLEFSFHKNVTHQLNLLLLFQFHRTQIFSFYLFISKVLSRILYSIFFLFFHSHQGRWANEDFLFFLRSWNTISALKFLKSQFLLRFLSATLGPCWLHFKHRVSPWSARVCLTATSLHSLTGYFGPKL